MHMAFAQARSTDAHEARLLLQLSDGGAADVTHAALYPADELVGDHANCAAIGNTAFDAFGDEFGETVGFGAVVGEHLRRRVGFSVLEVALAGTLRHGGQ